MKNMLIASPPGAAIAENTVMRNTVMRQCFRIDFAGKIPATLSPTMPTGRTIAIPKAIVNRVTNGRKSLTRMMPVSYTHL